MIGDNVGGTMTRIGRAALAALASPTRTATPTATTPTTASWPPATARTPPPGRSPRNVYWGWGTPLQTPRSAVTWWMNSSGHRANILDPALKDLGVGVVLGAPRPGSYPDAAIFVQTFGACTN
jgi:hypothetical protein